MKKLLLVLTLLLAGNFYMNAQTSKDILGQWQLVSGTDTSGKAVDVKALHKSEKVFNVFKENGVYLHVAGTKVDTGSWEFIPGSKEITVSINGQTALWKVENYSPNEITVSGSPGKFNFIRL